MSGGAQSCAPGARAAIVEDVINEEMCREEPDAV
jgi:hypothetical protein